MVEPIFKKENALIPVEEIDPAPWNVRKAGLDEDSLSGLVESIRSHGLLQPIVVYEDEEDGRYKVIIGQRRLAALKIIDPKRKIEVRLIEKSTAENMLAWSLSENVQRLDLKRKELVEAIVSLFESEGRKVRKVAGILGISVGTVYDYLNIVEVAPPRVLDLYKRDKISKTDVRRAVKAGGGDEDKASEIANELSKKRLTPGQRRKLATMGEQNKRLSAKELIERAKSEETEISLIVFFTEKENSALEGAADDIQLGRGEVVHNVAVDWLKEKGYL